MIEIKYWRYRMFWCVAYCRRDDGRAIAALGWTKRTARRNLLRTLDVEDLLDQ